MLRVLLRMLLSLALLLDGSGNAIASAMHAPGMPISMAQSNVPDRHQAGPPCGGMHAVASSAGGRPDQPAAPDPRQPVTDCCESGACACTSAQSVQFAAHSTLRQVFAGSQSRVVHRSQLKFKTPAQRQPIRPPIG